MGWVWTSRRYGGASLEDSSIKEIPGGGNQGEPGGTRGNQGEPEEKGTDAFS
jgi:hypothetical protein